MIRLEFSSPAEGFKHDIFAFLQGSELGFFPLLYSSFDFPVEEKKKAENNQSLKRKNFDFS